MDDQRPPQAIRERASRLTGGRISCAVVFDREFTPTEIERFYALPAGEEPLPSRFTFDSRLVRYDCAEDEEARWRLALEIFVVKSFRQSAGGPPTDPGIRTRLGFRKLHLG